ncbi:leucine--tRNA ligase [Sphingobacterium sp. SRCM116780]|uniref:leucine--tRNA ligase n=1 Tax=Sphingobacterium sp. SRCM116780 TaxID=2907623 RepID=UPI001F2CDA30|nr:class I tRNA ligase family protein [Sphingobacterium sp. SRCM116780]UIR57772.1 leucine--tRNA ligase [Sphingobacterium sp. SRCM116780]
MEYNHKSLEKKWQKFWADHETFKSADTHEKPKYYVLDMFPYPSGAGLHVGHPLGYIASDIFSRYKRLKGFNVLHPMGYDSFGLPAEQYAIQTGQHPAITTETNINRYREQLDNIGFSYDWSREVRTSDPTYYKWTQWIFMQLFNSWYNNESNKAETIDTLIYKFDTVGSEGIKAVSDDDVLSFTASEWKAFNEEQQQRELLKYRIAYLRESTVNWCAALGTVLANDEVINGVSERGGYPVEQKKMMQWSMRITAYADRMLQGLDHVDWPEPLVEMQRNWIGKSVGALVKFPVPQLQTNIEVFTTRVDTIYGVSFVVLAPEHELVAQLTTAEQQATISAYIDKTSKKSELDRMADTKTVSGAFTGSYAKHPITGEDVQIWIADYVLAGYGTGAVMAVPSGDQRDYLFAKHFNLPIIPISDSQHIDEEADANKDGKYINSGFINGMTYQEAVPALIAKLEELKLGKAKINFRMRDAIFGRQRYWGEPVPVYFKNGLPYLIKEEELPLLLPEVNKYLPTETGEPPLGRAENWKYEDQYEYELSTMPGWAGSSWYWFRYMDPKNEGNFASKEAVDYWKAVDLYIGGSEHATGHLLYSRFWNKFLKDLGFHNEEEPFKKLINQGMIQGRSNFVYKLANTSTSGIDSSIQNVLVSLNHYLDFKNFTKNFTVYQYLFLYKDGIYFNELDKVEELSEFGDLLSKTVFQKYPGLNYVLLNNDSFLPSHVDVNIVVNDVLNLDKFKASRPDYMQAEFILEDGKYVCGTEVEKMSKSKFNVVNPDDIIETYGADTLRLYEMFLGPLEQSKPWNTNGIEGVYKFLKKVWRLFHDTEGNFSVSDEEPTKAEYKALHKIIKKAEEDIERFSFNTSVSAFMICVNELTDLKCNKRAILEQLVIVLEPYAPHIAEELWSLLGNEAGSISYAAYPTFIADYLVESEFAYPVSINGKMKMNLLLALDLEAKAVEEIVLSHEEVLHYMDGKPLKKLIFVKGKIINIVI